MDILRGPYRAVRSALFRLLHPIRRHLAKRRIRALLPVRRIAILCTGNICRSPYAEARLRGETSASGRLEVVSAGLMGTNREPPVEAVAVAAERDLDLATHRSILFSLSLASWADLVVVMGSAQHADVLRDFGVSRRRILILADLDPQLTSSRTIFDPLDHPKEVFEDTYDQIDRCLGVLAQMLMENQ